LGLVFFIVYPARFQHLVPPDPFVYDSFHKLLDRTWGAAFPALGKILIFRVPPVASGGSCDFPYIFVLDFDVDRSFGLLGGWSLLGVLPPLSFSLD